MFDKGDCFIPYDDTIILRQIDGNRIKQNFITNIKGYKELTEDLIRQSQAKRTLTMLDNRELFCVDTHKILNFLLQGGGAIFMKKYALNCYLELRKYFKLNKDYGIVANIHDAIVIESSLDIADNICEILNSNFIKTSDYFGFSYPIKGTAKIGDNLYDIFKD